MTPEEVYQYFGSANKAAKALGITRAAVSLWAKRGFIPMPAQEKFHELTGGELKALEEDAKCPPDHKEEKSVYYLPTFRYYSKEHGMCYVESILFRKGKNPKITFRREDRIIEKFSVFSTKNLTQAVDVIDSDGRMVYEGDILLLPNGDKFTLKSIDMKAKLKQLGEFKIIGNVFEGETNGYTGS